MLTPSAVLAYWMRGSMAGLLYASGLSLSRCHTRGSTKPRACPPRSSEAAAIYCTCWSDFMTFSEIIRREGALIEGHRGVARKHPLLPALHWAMDAVRTWSQEFGLTPLSRTRLSVTVPAEEESEPKWLD